ncbi:BspA family leucine-rich repeat surface protein [Campylobacter jejuni]
MPKYFPNSKEELKALIKDESIYLGDIDTSKITDMSELFLYSKREDFSGIEKWDVRNVENMEGMFYKCYTFNQPLGDWDVSNVKDTQEMFRGCKSFNQDISGWDVSKVEDMTAMFSGCHSFNQDLSSWDVSNVKDMSYMFEGCYAFNQDLSSWDVSNVKNMSYMFKYCKINENFKPSNKKQKTRISELEKILNEIKSILSTIQIIEEKNIEFRKDMNIIAQHIVALRKTITQKKYTPETKEELKALVDNEVIHLGDIDTKYITDMSELFKNSTRTDFSGIEKWDVSKVKNMSCMFSRCYSFNQDLSSWDVSKVKVIDYMFYRCKNLKQSYRIKRR